MQLPIEKWVAETEIPLEARVAFSESVRCFKAGAYRAALLFGYLGWNLTLRARLLSAKCPANVVQGQWDKLVIDLRNEDKWDSALFDCTQTNPPKQIFDVSDDLRQQVRYWKDRRNDCAHFKNNEISSAHVEALWQFIQSNLGKFVPSGSIPDLLERLERHFDPNFTPPGADVMPVVSLIPSAVPKPDLPGFLSQLAGRLTTSLVFSKFAREAEIVSTLEAMLSLNNAAITSAVAGFLADNTSLLTNLLRLNPSRVLLYSGDPAVIRNLWRKLLFSGGKPDLPVFASLLRNGLIPGTEKAEAIGWVVSRLSNDIPSAQDLPTLQQEGFISSLQEWVFEKGNVNDFEWGNRNPKLIQWLLQQYPITEEIASLLCRVFVSRPYPFEVQPALRSLFASDPAKRAEFANAAAKAGKTPPNTLV